MPQHYTSLGVSARRRWHPLALVPKQRLFLFYRHFQLSPLPQSKYWRQPSTSSYFSKQPANSTISIPRPGSRQLRHPLHERCLIRTGLGLESLTATRLINHLARRLLGDAELSLEFCDCRSLPGRAYQFPSERCLSIWLSRDKSATKVLSRLFTSSRCFSRFASSHFIPPPTTVLQRCPARLRLSVVSLIAKASSTAARSLPALSIASASQNFATISSGGCFFRRLFVIESLLALWAVDLHINWIRSSKAGQCGGASPSLR